MSLSEALRPTVGDSSQTLLSLCLLNGGKAHVGDTGSGGLNELPFRLCVWNSAERGADASSAPRITRMLLHTDQTLLGSPTEGASSPTLTPAVFLFQNSREGPAAVTSSEAIPVFTLRLSAFPAVSHQALISGKGLSQNP